MDSLEYFFMEAATLLEKGLVAFFNFGDPIVVSIVLFIILSPFCLAYIIFARIAMVKLTQISIKGKNILYVIAHPDDEAM